MPINPKDSIPPPLIGKIGPYTVFMTPPPTPKPSDPAPDSPEKPVQTPVIKSSPPVQPPPHQYEKSPSAQNPSVGRFFRNAATKMQNAHSSLDDHLARWFGLNQSKYQWAVDDYYSNKGLENESGKSKDVESKLQNV